MPTPPKPFTVLTSEKKSHRTKAELKQRKNGEESLSTGVALKARSEVRRDRIAHKEFKRLNELLESIGKNDAIYEAIINRYCLLQSECSDLENKKSQCDNDTKELLGLKESRAIEFIEYLEKKDSISSRFLTYDKQLMTKRKMLFDIEKENIMTIAAALRSIPKKEEKASNPLLEALRNA